MRIATHPTLSRHLATKRHCLAHSISGPSAHVNPSDAVLEPVAPIKPDDDLSLDDARQRVADIEDEIAQLRAVPTPSPDVEKQIKAYVAALARPRVSGVASGQQLRVSWPNDVIAVLAMLQPEQMVAALVKEIDRHANLPLPLDERKKRISELEAEVEALQRRALALGADVCTMPAAIVLGVRVSRQKRAA